MQKQKKPKSKLRYSLEQAIEMVTTAFFSGLGIGGQGRIDDKVIERFKAEEYLIDAK